MALHQPSAAPIFDKRDRTQGILAYMPPEQAQKIRWSLDHRTDFYSLGVTFYELLTGQLPFTLEDRLEPIHYPPCHHPALPHQLEENIPASVSAVVMKLMAKRAKDRYQNALELKRDLETCLQQLQSSDRESS
jgi:serine/threonine protein kinase